MHFCVKLESALYIIIIAAIYSFKFILRVTVTIHSFNKCTRTARSSLNQFFFIYVHFRQHIHILFFFIHFHLITLEMYSWCMTLYAYTLYIYRFLCFTFRLPLHRLSFCYCFARFQLYMESRAWCS